MIALELSRPMIRQHFIAAVVGFCILFPAVIFDRRDPLTFIAAEIIPSPVVAGRPSVLRWTTEWSRACEGEVSREVIGSDGVIRPYRKRVLRVPIYMGRQSSDTNFIAASSLPSGAATYRATVRFHGCGLTSRLWPLEVKTDDIVFNVMRP